MHVHVVEGYCLVAVGNDVGGVDQVGVVEDLVDLVGMALNLVGWVADLVRLMVDLAGMVVDLVDLVGLVMGLVGLVVDLVRLIMDLVGLVVNLVDLVGWVIGLVGLVMGLVGLDHSLLTAERFAGERGRDNGQDQQNQHYDD